MPLELGIFLGAKYFGKNDHDRKSCLIFEAEAYTYDKFISDIKGQDIMAHGNEPRVIVVAIRNWLSANHPSRRHQIIGGNAVWRDYQAFSKWLPLICRKKQMVIKGLTFGDYVNLVYEWIESKVKITNN